jgi:hypothetical protein
MEGFFGGGDGNGCAAVVGGGVPLAEVVGLNFGAIGTNLLLWDGLVALLSFSVVVYSREGRTQSISSRSSDSRIQVLMMPVPLAALILTSTWPKKM